MSMAYFTLEVVFYVLSGLYENLILLQDNISLIAYFYKYVTLLQLLQHMIGNVILNTWCMKCCVLKSSWLDKVDIVKVGFGSLMYIKNYVKSHGQSFQ